jgi:hypothetical protein
MPTMTNDHYYDNIKVTAMRNPVSFMPLEKVTLIYGKRAEELSADEFILAIKTVTSQIEELAALNAKHFSILIDNRIYDLTEARDAIVILADTRNE